MRTLFVSNRLPIVAEKGDAGWTSHTSSGGLVTALAPVLRRFGGMWIGWTGASELQGRDLRNLMADFAMVGALIMAIFVAVRFFDTEQPKQWVLYATIFICDVILMALIKLWLYLCWVRNSIIREIKRAELRLLVGNEPPLKSN